MSEYEFTSDQNEAIDSLRQKLLHISVLHFLQGVLLLLQGHFFMEQPGLTYISIGGVIFITLGVLFMRPLDNLKRVITMTGEDIGQMMIAMDDFRIAFTAAAAVYAFGILTIIVMVLVTQMN